MNLHKSINKITNKKKSNYSSQVRKYGFYHCCECNKRWESGTSWVGFAQQCSKCSNEIHAYRFKSLEKKEDGVESKNDQSKPHRQDLCMKCQQLGYCCIRTATAF